MTRTVQKDLQLFHRFYTIRGTEAVYFYAAHPIMPISDDCHPFETCQDASGAWTTMASRMYRAVARSERIPRFDLNEWA